MSNIEEDIKNTKELIIGAKLYKQYEGNKYYKSMENILQDYTRQKQINEEHQKENGLLREKIKELEEKNKSYNIAYDLGKAFSNKKWEQKIKDKFEKIQLLYEENLKQVDLKEVEKIDRKIFEGIQLESEKTLLIKLLQESEDK